MRDGRNYPCRQVTLHLAKKEGKMGIEIPISLVECLFLSSCIPNKRSDVGKASPKANTYACRHGQLTEIT